jgi:mannose-6-phosphate isomerase-like protein (cupin superfamily)
VYVTGRRYRLSALDAIHVPAGAAHSLKNDSVQVAIMHTVFPTGTPEREFFDDGWDVVDCVSSDASVPESLVVHADAQVVALGESASVISLTDPVDSDRDVAARVVRLEPGAALELPVEAHDQSMFLSSGAVMCEVDDQRFDMANFCDTVCVRGGQARRLENRGNASATEAR